jgi:hypothetical protein
MPERKPWPPGERVRVLRRKASRHDGWTGLDQRTDPTLTTFDLVMRSASVYRGRSKIPVALSFVTSSQSEDDAGVAAWALLSRRETFLFMAEAISVA